MKIKKAPSIKEIYAERRRKRNEGISKSGQSNQDRAPELSRDKPSQILSAKRHSKEQSSGVAGDGRPKLSDRHGLGSFQYPQQVPPVYPHGYKEASGQGK